MMIKLSDGTVAHVTMAKRGEKPSPETVKAIEAVRDALLAICPGCRCYRYRCECADITQQLLDQQ